MVAGIPGRTSLSEFVLSVACRCQRDCSAKEEGCEEGGEEKELSRAWIWQLILVEPAKLSFPGLFYY